MIVVSNTTPLIGLATIGRFALLQQLFGQIYFPQAVYKEATVEVNVIKLRPLRVRRTVYDSADRVKVYDTVRRTLR